MSRPTHVPCLLNGATISHRCFVPVGLNHHNGTVAAPREAHPDKQRGIVFVRSICFVIEADCWAAGFNPGDPKVTIDHKQFGSGATALRDQRLRFSARLMRDFGPDSRERTQGSEIPNAGAAS